MLDTIGMRDDLKRLKLLRDSIIGIQIDIDILEKDLFAMTRDLEYMEIVKQTLIENLRILKQERLVVMASQYKKCIEEFDYVGKYVAQKKYEIKRVSDKLDRLYRSNDLYVNDYERQKKLIKSQKVILYLDPSKKKQKALNEE